jgi:hypothetical protein
LERLLFIAQLLLLLLMNVLNVEIGVVELCFCHPVAHIALCLVQGALECLVFVFWNCCFISQAIENVFLIGMKYPINPHGDQVLNYDCSCTPFNWSSSENINWTSLNTEECLVSNRQICVRARKIIELFEVDINQCQAC